MDSKRIVAKKLQMQKDVNPTLFKLAKTKYFEI